MKKKLKPKLKKSDLVTSKKDFFNLLDKAITPLSKVEGRKAETRSHDENTAKQTRSRKPEGAES